MARGVRSGGVWSDGSRLHRSGGLRPDGSRLCGSHELWPGLWSFLRSCVCGSRRLRSGCWCELRRSRLCRSGQLRHGMREDCKPKCCDADPYEVAGLIYCSQTACHGKTRAKAIDRLGDKYDCQCNPEIMCAFVYA